jgi:hypothetical protein
VSFPHSLLREAALVCAGASWQARSRLEPKTQQMLWHLQLQRHAQSCEQVFYVQVFCEQLFCERPF